MGAYEPHSPCCSGAHHLRACLLSSSASYLPCTAQAEQYNKQHDEMFKRLTAPEKTMLVCDVCGVFINSTDNDQRRRVRPSLGWWSGVRGFKRPRAKLSGRTRA